MNKWDSREHWRRMTGEPYKSRFDSEWSPRWDWWIGTVSEIADSAFVITGVLVLAFFAVLILGGIRIYP